MPLAKVIVLSACALVVVLSVLFLISYVRRTNRVVRDSQDILSDKELIEFINSQPDKIIDSKLLMEEFGLTKFEAGGRLRHFQSNGLVQTMSSRNGLKHYFTLARPIDKPYELKLTDDPFMTIEDLMLIFKHNDYQVTLQEICLSTGLPIKVILEEMKYFEKEKVIKCLLKPQQGGFYHQKVYTLCEPYRSNPNQYLDLKEANLELKEIVSKVNKA